MQRILEWSLVVAGALLCMGGAIGFWQAQLSSSAGTLWPLPTLVLAAKRAGISGSKLPN